jgi:hypothetical protein
VVRTTAERYGRALAYYLVQHSIFGFVEHHGVVDPETGSSCW